VDGLEDEIRVVVLVHHPSSLDAACSLTLLQEEVLSNSSSTESHSGAHSGPRTRPFKPNWTAPGPPKAQPHAPVPTADKTLETSKLPGIKEKLQSVKNYRRAKGLCFKCGEKWNPNHKCSKSVSLNWVEEIWQLIESLDSSDPCPDSDSGEDFMHLSISAAQGTDTAQTIRLVGTLF
jgi:hypothetical protein